MKLSTQLVKANFKVNVQMTNNNLIEHLIESLKLDKLPNLEQLKFDPEFIRFIAENIENEFTQKDKKGGTQTNSKLEIFFNIYDKLFGKLSEQDKFIINNILEHLIKNNLVKKQELSKVLVYYIKKKFI